MSKLRPHRGFTLLEVVVAMMLVSVMAAVGFAVLRTGLRSWEAGESRMERLEGRLVLAGFLRGYLANALPAMDDFSGDKPEFAFVGAPDVVRFVAFPPDYVGQGIRYRFALGADRNVLGVIGEPFGRRLLSGTTQAERIPLLDRVFRVRFAYFGRTPDSRGPEWQPEWRFSMLPELVRVTVQAADGTFESVVSLRNRGKS